MSEYGENRIAEIKLNNQLDEKRAELQKLEETLNRQNYKNYPAITTYGMVWVRDAQHNVSGYVTVKVVTQGQKVISTEISKQLGVKPVAENAFRHGVVKDIFEARNDIVDITMDPKTLKYHFSQIKKDK